MPFVDKDGTEKQIDLLMAVAQFRAKCQTLAPIADKTAAADKGFETELALLTTRVREWWEDYKHNWRTFYP